MSQPITFFIHHQGRGHANRAMAIIRELPPERMVTILTAKPSLFDGFERPIAIAALPDMIGAPVPTPGLFAQATPEVMHCVPLGVTKTRATMRTIIDHLDDVDPALFVVDVSAEIALLARDRQRPGDQHPDARRPARSRASRRLSGECRPARAVRRSARARRHTRLGAREDMLRGRPLHDGRSGPDQGRSACETRA
ncbi:hypothetical protein [Sphingomonas sp. LR55]|uniref:hypothetical protein n=1 Tax=Sphingomonas sp. LR55 TaxID=3050231 RepID=UPI002FE04B19